MRVFRAKVRFPGFWFRAKASPSRKMTIAAQLSKPQEVCVIGGGAAGLVGSKELRAEGLIPTVFEKGSHIGGVWSYDPRVESDPLGQDAARDRVHSSMYASLRTNLPREVMGYLDFPFDATRRWSSDARRFCGHAEVQRYLEAYAAHHRIQVELNHSVERVSRRDGGAGGGWEAVVRGPGGESVSRRFDAVMVCNGHYSEPKVPPVRRPGGDERPFPGAEVHSHNYRDSRGYEGKSVVVVGAMSSGEDISREIAEVASTVYLSANSWQNPQWGTPEARREPMGQKGNIWRRPMVSALHSDGTVEFADGTLTDAPIDVVLYCTGYQYSFPFLGPDLLSSLGLSVGDGAVRPLYKQVIAPLDPTLSFIGLPWKVVPFPQFELQARWAARVISGRAKLPPAADMLSDIEAWEAARAAAGIPGRHYHMLGDAQWDYNRELAQLAGPGGRGTDGWRPLMYKATGNNKRANPESYRDSWADHDLAALAQEEFSAVWEGSGGLGLESASAIVRR